MVVILSILNFLKTNESARKIFGKQEIKIIEKQLSGVNLTQSEKNRLSRDIREKFKFIKEVSRFEDDFELKKGGVIKKLIEEAKQVIIESEYFPKIKEIILFGSVVENRLNFRSDIDIAVRFFEISLREATKFRIYVSGRVNNKLDIQVYNILPEKIKKEIDLKGKVLYEKKGQNGEKQN